MTKIFLSPLFLFVPLPFGRDECGFINAFQHEVEEAFAASGNKARITCQNDEAAATVIRLNGGMRSVPTIVFPDGSVLVEPSARQLAAKFAV